MRSTTSVTAADQLAIRPSGQRVRQMTLRMFRPSVPWTSFLRLRGCMTQALGPYTGKTVPVKCRDGLLTLYIAAWLIR